MTKTRTMSRAGSPAAGLVDHPLEETAHRDTEACRLGLDPGAPVVVEADAYNGGLGGRHGPVNSNPGRLHQRRRMVAARWWAPGRDRFRIGSGTLGGGSGP